MYIYYLKYVLEAICGQGSEIKVCIKTSKHSLPYTGIFLVPVHSF